MTKTRIFKPTRKSDIREKQRLLATTCDLEEDYCSGMMMKQLYKE